MMKNLTDLIFKFGGKRKKVNFKLDEKPIEVWKDIKGLEKLYQISNWGRIRSLNTIQKRTNGKKVCEFKIKGKILKTYQTGKGYKNNNGYETITILNKRYKIHRLVAEAFIPNPDNLPQVNHKDGNKHNNKIDNLEWCTNKENSEHAWKTGLMETNYKTNRKLTCEQVQKIREECIPGNKEKGYKPLGRKYNVSFMTIKKIVRREKWKNVN